MFNTILYAAKTADTKPVHRRLISNQFFFEYGFDLRAHSFRS